MTEDRVVCEACGKPFEVGQYCMSRTRKPALINAIHPSALIMEDAVMQDKIILPKFGEDCAWMFFPIVCKDGVDRDKLCLFLEENGIQTRYIMPLTNQPVYHKMWKEKDYPIADWVNRKGFLIGVHHLW